MDRLTTSKTAEGNVTKGRVAVQGSSDGKAKLPGVNGAGDVLGIFTQSVEDGQHVSVAIHGLLPWAEAGADVNAGKFAVATTDETGKLKELPGDPGTYKAVGQFHQSGGAGELVNLMINPHQVEVV